MEQPVHSLARGDAFSHRRINRLLRRLQLLPVFRTSEGHGNLGQNYATFDACRETFLENGIVLIFSEGRCENEWHLRPLKKGTARLAITSWEKNIPLQVVPVGINYSSFRKFGKEVHLYFGQPLDREAVLQQEPEGKKLLEFNRQLQEGLQPLVYEIEDGDENRRRQLFPREKNPYRFLMMLPAATGWLLHAPLYYSCKLMSRRFYDSGHYDSVLTSLLVVLYPFYLLLMAGLAFPVFSWGSLALFVLMPMLAKKAVEGVWMTDEG